jgi:serine/threonine protein kinase
MNVDMKRQRSQQSDIDVASWFSCGEDSIHELVNQGNSTLTRGAFGELSIAIRAEDNKKWQFVAIKTIERSIVSNAPFGQQGKRQLTREVFHELCALRHLNPHPNIIPLLAVYPAKQAHLSQSSLSFAFPYCPTDLHLALECRRRAFQPLLAFDVIKTIARDVFSALHHCHSFGILHRDIKPGNLLVSSTGIIQLCDFGLAKPFVEQHSSSSLPKPDVGETGSKGVCTLYYRPPELLLGGLAAEPSVDMYSVGTVLAELVIGQPLFPGRNVIDQLAIEFDLLGTPTDSSWPDAKDLPDYGKLNFATKTPKSWEESLPRVMECPHLPELLKQLVALDPKQRLTSRQALDHEWLSMKPNMATYYRLREELIPRQLKEPVLLSSKDLTIASRQALKLASARRSFLSTDIVEWKGKDVTTASLRDLCNDFQK